PPGRWRLRVLDGARAPPREPAPGLLVHRRAGVGRRDPVAIAVATVGNGPNDPCVAAVAPDRSPAHAPHRPSGTPADFEDVGRYLPAAFAMFEEELGLTPADSADRPGYRVRLTQLIAAGHALVRLDDRGAVIFKVELAAVSSQCCQVQGVWVRPDLRGRGIGAGGMAAVLD